MMLYLQMIPKSLIPARIYLSLLNFSSTFPAPCWIFASNLHWHLPCKNWKISFPPIAPLCLFLVDPASNASWTLSSFPLSHLLPQVMRTGTRAPFCLTPKAFLLHQKWPTKLDFICPPGHGKIRDLLRLSLSFPSLSLSSPRRKTNVFLLTYLSWGEGTACRPQWPWHSCSCQPAELPDFPLYRCWWLRQWHASFHLGWQLWSQCQPILPKKTFGNNMTVKANIGRTENNCTFF